MSAKRPVVWFHRTRAIGWVLLTVPAVLWWADSILLAILLSLYANAVSDWGAAEAADDSHVFDRIKRIERLLEEIHAQRADSPDRLTPDP